MVGVEVGISISNCKGHCINEVCAVLEANTGGSTANVKNVGAKIVNWIAISGNFQIVGVLVVAIDIGGSHPGSRDCRNAYP